MKNQRLSFWCIHWFRSTTVLCLPCLCIPKWLHWSPLLLAFFVIPSSSRSAQFDELLWATWHGDLWSENDISLDSYFLKKNNALKSPWKTFWKWKPYLKFSRKWVWFYQTWRFCSSLEEYFETTNVEVFDGKPHRHFWLKILGPARWCPSKWKA